MEVFFGNTFSTILILSGGICLIVGGLTKIFPPKNINVFYGYRTRRSKKNLKNWKFAQSYSAKVMIWTSIGLMIIGAFGVLIDIPKRIGVIVALFLILVWAIFLILKTENALKKFEENS